MRLQNRIERRLPEQRLMHLATQAQWRGACAEAARKGVSTRGFSLPPSFLLENRAAHCQKKKTKGLAICLLG